MDKVLKRRELILNGNLMKTIILLALPVAINEFIRALYNVIDTYFVSSIGTIEVASVTFVGPFNMMIGSISVGLAVAATTLIAREISKEQYDVAKNISMQLIFVALVLGGVITVVAFMFSRQILTAAFASSAILDIANLYFRLTVLATPFVFLNSAYLGIKRAEGETAKAMRINITAMVIKVIVSYVLLYHFNLGIRSLAISTIVGTFFVSVVGLIDLFIIPSVMKLSFNYFKMTEQVFIALLIIGVPIMIEKASSSFSFIVMNKYVIAYGESVLASYGITNRINSLFFATVSGFASGLAPIVSQNLGINQVDRTRAAIKRTYLIALGISIVLISVVLPSREAIVAVFSGGDQEVLKHTVNAMGVYSISVIPWAIFQVTNGIFQGTGYTIYNMLLSIIRIYLFRIPIVILLANFTLLNEYSIWYSMLISNTLTGICAFLLYLIRRKKLEFIKT